VNRPLAHTTLVFSLLVAACTHTSYSGEKGGVVTVAASSEAVGKAFAGRRLALVIGINQVSDERWRPLKFANKDAADLATVLQDSSKGGYDSVTTVTLGSQTTRDALRASIRKLAQEATHPEDVVLLYVSAHGTLARDGKGNLRRYLVTSDADYRRVAETALPVEELSSLLDSSGSRRRVIVLATCHSGSGKSLLSSEVESELASLKGGPALRPLEEVSKASIVLSASDWGETAREDETLQNDVYTHFLVEALSGTGDRNGDGAVTATEAHDFARRRTWVFSQGRQRPSAEILEVGADPVVLSGSIRRAGQPELFSYSPRLDGFTLRIDGETRAELPGGVAVPAGGHRIELTKGDEILLRDDFTVETGQRLDLDQLVQRHEPNTAVSFIGGGFSFIDQKSRTELLPAAPAVGVAIRVDHVLLRRVALEADVSGFGGSTSVSIGGGAPLPFTWSSVLVGGTALFSWDWRWLSLWAGPRVAALIIQRSFALDAYQGNQLALSVTPGVLVGGAVRLTSRWEISLNLQTMLSVLTVDGKPQVLGFAGAFAGVGYRY
jgi:hypothetical protein